MGKTSTYRIIENCNLILQYYSGDINIDDIIRLQKTISLEPNYKSTFTVLWDFRTTNLLIKKSDLKRYLEFIKNYSKIFGKRKVAFLTNKPNEVAVTTIFSWLLDKVPIYPMTFTTIEAAVRWIDNITIDKNQVNEILEELKTQPNNINNNNNRHITT